MSELNITIDGGTSKKLLTAGKFCDKNIIVTATGGSAAEPVIETLDITANGTYTAPDGVDGYSPVTVNVPQDGGLPDEAFVITGNCSYRFTYDGWNWFINTYGNKITTSNITRCNYMFSYSNNITNIPFDINISDSASFVDMSYMFNNCANLESIRIIKGGKVGATDGMFHMCYKLRNLPDNISDYLDWTYIDNLANTYSCPRGTMFNNCFSLRSIPMDFLAHANKGSLHNYSYFSSGFTSCASLDELMDLPIPYTATWTSNAFSSTFNSCFRLKNMTFAMLDGQPYIMNWKSQTIDLTKYLGYAQYYTYVTEYNSGITADKRVTDDTTYQALKDDPDWFTEDINYSRYNHDSAVATIQSLPDTSAYLASAGGTNTIKFKGAAGSATDGGAINTLTEAEIAVATAKGWTVTLV